jgi:hypothetical protein
MCPVLVLALSIAGCSTNQTAEDVSPTRIKYVTDSLLVDYVWAGHPVGFDVLSSERYQYIAYYDSARNMCIAQRQYDERHWHKTILPTQVGWDSHNSIVIAEDDLGHLHVSGNMHGDTLIYFRTSTAHDIETFRSHRMTGKEETRVTYPVFFKDTAGDLYFQYRQGSSGDGITYINKYSPESEAWQRIVKDGLFDGEDETNAYPNDPVPGPDGYFHYLWVWRLNPIANTNHNLSYMKTPDFVRFFNTDDEIIPLPVLYRERRVIADPVGPWNGLMNSTKRLSFDSKGRVLLGYHKFDHRGHSQLFLARHNGAHWVQKQVSDWPDFTWEINKRGSLGNGIGLHAIETDSAGHIYVAYSHERYGSGLLKIDEESLDLTEMLPDARLVQFTDMGYTAREGMQINARSDDQEIYHLRWMTLPANYDRPREPPYPPPARLMLYRTTDGHQE